MSPNDEGISASSVEMVPCNRCGHRNVKVGAGSCFHGSHVGFSGLGPLDKAALL